MKKLLVVALLSLFIVSCNNDDETITEQTYSSCLNLVIDTQSGTQTVFTTGSYAFKFNYTTATVDITVNNLPLTEDGSLVNFNLTGLSWGYDSNGFKIASASSATPMLNGQPLSGYTVENVKLSILDRYIYSGDYFPVINLSMTVNGIYDVVVVQTQNMYFGSTVSTTIETGSTFTTDDTYYIVYFDGQKKTATVYLYNVQFASSMATMDMVFDGVSYTLSRSGYTLECDDVIPLVSGTSYPDYEVTNLSCSATFSDGGTLRYDCMSTYNVQVDLKLF